MKLFVYFSEVPRGAGPFTYAPGTHPLGHRRDLPPHDAEYDQYVAVFDQLR